MQGLCTDLALAMQWSSITHALWIQELSEKVPALCVSLVKYLIKPHPRSGLLHHLSAFMAKRENSNGMTMTYTHLTSSLLGPYMAGYRNDLLFVVKQPANERSH